MRRVVPMTTHSSRSLLASCRHAWTGLVETVAYQRNMRIHLVSAMAVSLVGSGLTLGLAEKVTLLFCVLLVFFAEILNSALEHLVDLAIREVDEHARKAKDAAAAGVLVLALGTAAIFSTLLVHNAENVVAHRGAVLRQVAFGLPLLLCATALLWRPKFRASDAALAATGTVFWAFTTRASTSWVFSALSAALLFVAWRGARRVAQPIKNTAP